MPDSTRKRIEWYPGDAAIEALQLAAQEFPKLRQQALLDFLLMTGLSALLHEHWRPPALHGTNRHRWKVPPALQRSGEANRRDALGR